jgi:hypothetical protein
MCPSYKRVIDMTATPQKLDCTFKFDKSIEVEPLNVIATLYDPNPSKFSRVYTVQYIFHPPLPPKAPK